MDKNNPISPAPQLKNLEKDDEVDLMGLALTLWGSRKTLIISITIGAILGLFFAFSAQRIYTVTTVMVPQMSSSDKSQLGGLAALAGISIGMSQNTDMSPLVYPKIVNSVPFKLELMNTPINFSTVNHPVSLYEYFTKYSKPTLLGTIKKYTVGLPMLILKSIRKKPNEISVPSGKSNLPIHLTRMQFEIKELLDDMIGLDADKKEGILTLTVQMTEPLATAQLAKKAQELLQRDITNFKIEKTRADLNFIQGRFNVAKADFENVQVDLASVTDRNRDLTSGLSTVQRDRVQTRYTIAYSVYQDLAKQLEQAKIQVKKETPMFTVVEPVTIPSESTKPNRPLILIIWMFLGGMVGVGLIYGKSSYKNFKQKWHENSTSSN